MSEADPPAPAPHKRRPRYRGTHPRRFEQKYKELQPGRYGDTVEKVISRGKTPAGQHLPIMVNEILDALAIRPGQRVVDCTLGYGGHAAELLKAVQPDGVLLGLDQDPIEIEKTEARLRARNHPETSLVIRRINFAGLLATLSELGWTDGVDAILADLGVSSMQIDNPQRGFSFKLDGPLDMRMNPQRGFPASELLARTSIERLTTMLRENSDEPHAEVIASVIAGKTYATTLRLRDAILTSLPRSVKDDEREASVRRVFQALRIEVNGEFSALDGWLRTLPQCLRPGGRVAVLTFHSGEDRRVKKAFQSGQREGVYQAISEDVIRASAGETQRNPRASSAKLRWAVKAL